jgi:hypothetical protein
MKWKTCCKRIRRRRVKDLRSCCRSCCSKVSKRGRGVGRRRRRRRRRRIRIGNPRQIDVIRSSQIWIRIHRCSSAEEISGFFFWVCVWRSADLQLAAKNPQHSLLQKRIL